MGQSISTEDDAQNDMEQYQPSNNEQQIYTSIYQQTSSIELDCSEDLFGPDNIWSNLPLDAIKYIFEFLPFTYLFNASRVCKKFNSLCWKHLKEIDISKESKSALYVNDQVLVRVLSLIPNIKRLSLYCCRLLTSESLELIAFQTNLESLDLSYVPRLTLESLSKIAKECKKLKRLVLGGSYSWKTASSDSFPYFPSLEVLVVKRSEIMTKQFREFLSKHFKTLKGLNIDNPQSYSQLDLSIMSDILTNENCREQLIFLNLNFSKAHIYEERFDFNDSVLINLKHFKKLKGLSISTLGKHETCKSILNSIGNQLEYLNICSTGPSNDVTNALLSVPLRNLKVLSLHRNEYQMPRDQAENIEKILQCALNKDGDLGRLECFEFCYVKHQSNIDELVSKFNPFFKNIREWKRRLGFDDY